METYNITYKDLKKAITKVGYDNHSDIWYLFDIIISRRGYSLDYIKDRLIAGGIIDKKKIIILLGIKLKQIIAAIAMLVCGENRKRRAATIIPASIDLGNLLYLFSGVIVVNGGMIELVNGVSIGLFLSLSSLIRILLL